MTTLFFGGENGLDFGPLVTAAQSATGGCWNSDAINEAHEEMEVRMYVNPS